ncbi:MAG TPA: hypothetical protein VJR27_02950 [Candidatus Saccharimonadales bacterium]|nr:hypothetical protein [Candidatus Saccharimonadales bacterium]
MATHRAQYSAVIGKKRWMQSEGKFSVPDDRGSKVAIMVPFLPELIQDPRDNYEQFEAQVAAYEAHYKQKGREPFSVMGATIDDFRGVLSDETIPSVVVTGWGSMSSIAAPFSSDRSKDARYGYLDWLHFSDMATHVKLGDFVMLQCGGFKKEFNPPLPLGMVSSHTNILGTPGLAHYAAQSLEAPLPPDPITTAEELSYAAIKELFPLRRDRRVPLVPEAMIPAGVYTTARDWYNQHLNTGMPDIPPPEPLSQPNLGKYRQYARLK